MKVNAVIQGDCLEVMRGMDDKSVDLIITDPPYGVKRDKGFGGFEGFRGAGKLIKRKAYSDDWDSERPSQVIFDMICRVSSNALIFGGNYFADILPQGKHWIVWDKLNTMPTFGDCELIWTNIKRTSVSKVTVEYNGLLGKEKHRSHPTQKPISVVEWLIQRYSKPNDIILDPFCGSGTTLVAAKNLGRRYIGIEIEEKYCEIARQRLAQQTLELR